MNEINQHEFSSEWKMAMDTISQYFSGIDQIFPSTSSGYCILLHAKSKNWDINELISKLNADSDLEDSENLNPPFWWKEWESLLATLESQFGIKFPKEIEKKERIHQETHVSTTKFNPNLPIEKIAEAVSRLSSGESLNSEFFFYESYVSENEIQSNPWSSTLVEQTRYVLNDLPISSFLRDGHCILKSMHHEYGKISIHDVIAYKFKIKDVDSDELLFSFDTLDELIEAGWVVD